MTGAKVTSEEARKKGLCFSCGKGGHLARNCRQKNYNQQRFQRTRDANDKDVAVRMMRMTPETYAPKDHEQDEEGYRTDLGPMDVSSLFQGFTSNDFSETGSSNEERLDEEDDPPKREEFEEKRMVPSISGRTIRWEACCIASKELTRRLQLQESSGTPT